MYLMEIIYVFTGLMKTFNMDSFFETLKQNLSKFA